MKPPLVDSRSNSLVRLFRSVRDGKEEDSLFIEGFKILEEAFASNVPVKRIVCRPEDLGTLQRLLAQKGKTHIPVVFFSQDVLSFVSDTDTPQGCIALAARPRHESTMPDNHWSRSFVLVACGLQHPQNLGNIIRTAEAAGVEEVWTLKGNVDPFSPKVVRGSSGSVFRVPLRIKLSWKEALSSLKARQFQCLAAVADGKKMYDEEDWRKPTALFLGSEGSGFSSSQLEDLPQTIRIPMKGSIESLNVGTAAAVCLFEAARQRKNI